jgi:hypothetical protein
MPPLIPSSTPTPTEISFTPMWTPLATIPPGERQAYIKALINENPDCVLPCWLGITPGETTLEEAWHLLSPYASELIIRRNYFEMWFDLENKDEDVLIHPDLYSPEWGNRFEIKDEVVSFIWAKIYGAKDRYPLSTVLETYGKPSEIWFGVGALFDWSGSLYLHYSNVGMMLYYDSVVDGADDPEGDQLIFCFQEVEEMAFLWDPNLNISYQDIIPEVTISRRLTIEEVTGMSIDEFYSTFKDKDQACIESSKEMWRKIIKENRP